FNLKFSISLACDISVGVLNVGVESRKNKKEIPNMAEANKKAKTFWTFFRLLISIFLYDKLSLS
ncbi:MAG: hypothetical protein VXW56_03655, partial [Bacteroidota bacterium]|nr:hypothetical protein [Bacteroidota bacterium]